MAENNEPEGVEQKKSGWRWPSFDWSKKNINLNDVPFKEVFDENDLDWLSHTVTEYVLGQSAKLVVKLLGSNPNPKEFKTVFKNVHEEKIKFLENLLNKVRN